ncbi:Uma2 family endonuclease [Pseudanabaena sp. PCC 6802]|uniref:Uma2 family endonuclease n=1 Tax=Pseudanabaena sp. PCC 6802 TaxID=118173 RepID=UPI00034D63A1|nr:Uma2 family endonuclease [Pseudanabaena sp. PCC 6802]
MVIANLPSPLTILENGDRLNRKEFERRYAASNIKKAELIEGIVHVASALRFISHAKPHGQLFGWLAAYQSMTAGLEIGIEPTVRLDNDNEPQPDVVLFRLGGNARIDADGYITGAPELIAEIAASTVSYDLHSKKRAYERNGVKEYIVWRTLDREIDWFVLEDGIYQNLEPDSEGVIYSREFAGLGLNVQAILGNDYVISPQDTTNCYGEPVKSIL